MLQKAIWFKMIVNFDEKLFKKKFIKDTDQSNSFWSWA